MIYSTEEEKENLKKYIHDNKVEEKDNIFKYYGGNMKIIDLLNKIANGEQPPKRFLKNGNVFVYNEKEKDYVDEENEYLFIDYLWQDMLGDEIEILETTITYKPDKIEKVDIFKQNGKIYLESYCYNYPPLEKLPLSNEEIAFVYKINEIIDKLTKEQK